MELYYCYDFIHDCRYNYKLQRACVLPNSSFEDWFCVIDSGASTSSWLGAVHSIENQILFDLLMRQRKNIKNTQLSLFLVINLQLLVILIVRTRTTESSIALLFLCFT